MRYSDFTTVTRSHSADPATRDAGQIVLRARRLLDRTEACTRPVRLLGVTMHNLSAEENAPPGPGHPTLPLSDAFAPAGSRQRRTTQTPGGSDGRGGQQST